MTDKERIFNYRLSRARRIVENAFSILANRFRCLLSTLHLSPEKVKQFILTTVNESGSFLYSQARRENFADLSCGKI